MHTKFQVDAIGIFGVTKINGANDRRRHIFSTRTPTHELLPTLALLTFFSPVRRRVTLQHISSTTFHFLRILWRTQLNSSVSLAFTNASIQIIKLPIRSVGRDNGNYTNYTYAITMINMHKKKFPSLPCVMFECNFLFISRFGSEDMNFIYMLKILICQFSL